MADEKPNVENIRANIKDKVEAELKKETKVEPKAEVKVGVGVIIKNDDKVLLGKRKNAHGEGSWCFPGGHLEFNEQIEECARREVLEETGIRIKNLQSGIFTNDIFEKENKHYITLFMISDYDSGNVQVMEPEKCERWEWFEWDKLPQPLFIPIKNMLEKNFNPYS